MSENFEIVEKGFDELLKISREEKAERKECAQVSDGEGAYIRARILVNSTWYVGEKRLLESSYSIVGSDHHFFPDMLEGEIRFDGDCHPFFRGKYDKGIGFKEYNILFLRNTDLGSGWSRINQKLLDKIYQKLKGYEGCRNLLRKFEKFWEERKKEHRKKKERYKRRKYLENIDSRPENEPESLPRKLKAFRRRYRSFLKGDYEKKVEKTGKLRKRAFRDGRKMERETRKEGIRAACLKNKPG